MRRDAERIRADLRKHGDERRAARAADRQAMGAIVALLPEALEAGITKREFAQLTGVSRVWIDALLRRNQST